MARLLIVGSMQGDLGRAASLARSGGAQVIQADTPMEGLALLRGKGADLIFCDVAQDVAWLLRAMEAERIVCPLVACGRDSAFDEAQRAIRDGAREFLPLPPDALLIASMLRAVADAHAGAMAPICRDPAMQALLALSLIHI